MNTKLMVALVAAVSSVSVQADFSRERQVLEFVDEMVAEHGFQRDALIDLFRQVEVQESVIARISRPAESMSWDRYRAIFITNDRIQRGVNFARENSADLGRAEERFGVPPKIVAAIIGVETFYGRIMGRDRVIDAISTLAFRYPPRASFFRGELKEFLLLACEEGLRPFAGRESCSSSRSEVAALAGDMTVLDLVGSYAGAMGYGQFISSSYRKWAIDFDGDRSRDIWNNTTDAIGSVANYFAEHGWKGARPAFEEVVLATPDAPAAEFASTGLDLTRTVREWKELGVQTDGKDQAKAALFRMEAEGGNEYWLGYHDYYVISRYNRSALYSLVVWQLSELIGERL